MDVGVLLRGRLAEGVFPKVKSLGLSKSPKNKTGPWACVQAQGDCKASLENPVSEEISSCEETNQGGSHR